MVVIIEDIYDQIVRQGLLKKDNISKYCVQTTLKYFIYSYLDLDLKNYGLDQNKIKISRDLKDRYMILKPAKGQRIVLINKNDYYNSLERLFSDKNKIEVVNEDLTLRNLFRVQNYLNSFFSRGKITEEQKKDMRSKFAIGKLVGHMAFQKYTNKLIEYQFFD